VRASGHPHHEEIQARIGAGPARRDYEVVNGNVAVIPIYGVITPKADLMSEMSGGTSVERISQTFARRARRRRHPRHRARHRLARRVSRRDPGARSADPRGARHEADRRSRELPGRVRRVLARAQADEFFAAPSADVGSVGVFAAHNDVSAALEQARDQDDADLGRASTSPRATRSSRSPTRRSPRSRRASTRCTACSSPTSPRGGASASTPSGRTSARADAVGEEGARRRHGRRGRHDREHDPPRRPKAGQPASQAATSDEPALQAGDTTSFSDDLDAAHRAIDVVVTRGETLRVLTATKRDQLAHLAERLGALVESTTAEPKREPDDESIDLEAEFLAIATRRRLETATT
jgi:hypothetical protein